MIVFALRCPDDHRFEAWFRDGATYELQAASGEISCPSCGDTAISKAPMAPSVLGSRAERQEVLPPAAEAPPPEIAEAAAFLRALRRTVEAQCDYVGPEFAEEARRIHYGETSTRAIYGETTQQDAEALIEEGIEVKQIPWLPTEN